MAGVRTIKRGKRIPEEIQEALAQAYISDKNCTICQICQRFGVSETAARKILRSRGIKIRMTKKPWEPWEDELICKMYQEGSGLGVIARTVERPITSLKRRLQKLGLLEPAAPKLPQKPFIPRILMEGKLIEGKAYKTKLSGVTSELDDLRAILLIYLGKHGRHHLFQSKNGKWKTAFTDVQLADLELEVV